MICMFQEICKQFIHDFVPFCAFNIVISGSEILKWFTHQGVGNIVNAQVTYRNENKWIGNTMCVVSSCPNFNPYHFGRLLTCRVLINEHKGSVVGLDFCPIFPKSSYLWMSYFLSKMFNENERAVLSQIDENGFIQMELRFQWYLKHDVEINKCGFCVVYEQDMRVCIREMILAQSSNSTCITPYEGLDVQQKESN